MKKDDVGQKMVAFTVKDIPRNVLDKIKKRAIRNDRSMNKEIVAILRRQK